MTQYFQAVNKTEQEYAILGGAMSPTERMTNSTAMAKLGMLLYEHDAGHYDYYGRWAGDEVVLVGDYDDSGLYDEIKPTVSVAPLSNPHLIKHDAETTTAPDPESVTEPYTVEVNRSPPAIIKGSWNKGRHDCSHPSQEHPDPDTDIGTYVELRERYDDELDEDTFGVVMAIENDWTDVTDGMLEEAELVLDDEELAQNETVLMPRAVLEA